MIITNKEYGQFNVNLSDGGTLDTLISVEHNGRTEDIGYSQEYAANYRDTDGTMTDDGFAELAEDAVNCFVELYLI